MIDLTVPADALSEEREATLVSELPRAIITWEEGTDVPGYDHAAWTFVHEAMAIAGKVRSAEQAPIYREFEFGKR